MALAELDPAWAAHATRLVDADSFDPGPLRDLMQLLQKALSRLPPTEQLQRLAKLEATLREL